MPGGGGDASRGASGRACEGAGECACAFTGPCQTRTWAASFTERGQWYPAAVGVCFALGNLLRFGPQRWGSNFVTCWALQFRSLEVSCRSYFFLIIFPLSPPPPTSWSICCMRSDSVLGPTWLHKGKKLVCVMSFSERDGSEQPCSLFVAFELCKSLFSQAEPLDRIHS